MGRIWRTAIWAGALISLMPIGGPLFAVDPERNLTQYAHRIWQAQQGLPQAPIYAITQDKTGYIWLGTGQGIVRFDGVRFSPLPALVRHPLGDPWVTNLVEDSSGRMWILTNNGTLVRVTGENVKTFSTTDGLPSNEVSCLAKASDGGVWACTRTGLAHFRGDTLDFHPAPDQSFPEPFTHACESANHVVWAGGAESRELLGWNGSGWDVQTIQIPGSGGGTRSLRCAGNRLWVGTNDGLVEIQDGHERRFLDDVDPPHGGLPDNVVLSFGETNGDELWVGTRKGLSRYRNGEFTNYGSRDGLSQSTVYAIYEDREGSVWVGTKNGLNQFVDSETTLYTTFEGLPTNDVGPVLEDVDGQIWGGTLGAGLFHFDGKRFKVLRRGNGLASDTVKALAEGPDGAIWAGTTQGLTRIQNGQAVETYREQQGLPSRKIRALLFDHANVLWAATELGAARLVGNRFIPISSDPELREPVAALGETAGGEMLFALKQGPVYRLAGERLTKISDGRVRDVDTFLTDSDGYVWMGTNGAGLLLWKDGKIVQTTMRDGLPDGQIFDIVADGPDRAWIASSNGYYSVSRSNLHDFAAGKSNRIEGTPYNWTLRLRTIESQPEAQPVVWRSRTGHLWFSTIRGLLEFQPEPLGKSAPAVRAVIDETIVNGESVKPDGIELLAPGRKSITFHYTALSFVHPEQMTFRYRLTGYDADWIDAGNRRDAFYTNLPPGEYRFEVMACRMEAECGDTAASIRFGLAPEFYQRAWFLPLCGILLGLLGWGIYRLRVQQMNERFLVVVGERNRIARELHDTLIQGFSGITMQMQAFAGRLRDAGQRETLADIIKDAGTCLQETRRSVAGLRSGDAGISGLAAALAESARHITEPRDIRLKLKLDERPYEISPEVKYNLLRIAQEALTNAVKHAGARAIEIELSRTANGVYLIIGDDGRGFPQDGSSRSEPLHYGIVGMRERASQIGAGFDLDSAPGKGTRIRVTVPLHQEARATETQTQEART